MDSLTYFAKDVLKGLSAKPKKLSSRYFYDAIGDKLFQQIMALEEYYPTRTEHEILETRKQEILKCFDGPFRLIELGAGDGKKTKVLLKYFVDQKVPFTYSPVDISEDILEELRKSLVSEIPDLKVEPLTGDYFHVMEETVSHEEQRNVVLFLGSNIGNYSNILRDDFLQKLRENLKKGDQTLIGFDLKKDPQTILNAYNDSQGVTRDFNKNLLTRINNELGGNFDLDKFQHFPSYNPDTGECRSYLLSTETQVVNIAELDATFHFTKWEPIFMEISKKFNFEEISELAERHDFKVTHNFTDSKDWYVDSVWEAI
ncbi:MAG: L-histidine N(alpha)-methyltransferase [Bacteroidota bacterium]